MKNQACRMSVAVLSLAAFGLTHAADTKWKPTGTGDWQVSANWSAGLPSIGGNLQAYVNNGSTVTVTGACESAGISIGNTAGKRDELRLIAGAASLSNTVNLISMSTFGTGVLVQATGSIWNDKGLRLGYYANSMGRYELSGGTNIMYADLTIGANVGRGEVRQSGGYLELRTAGVNNGRFYVSDGEYWMTGGRFVNTGLAFAVTAAIGKSALFVLDGPAAELRLVNKVTAYIGNGGNGRMEMRQGSFYAEGGISVANAGATNAVFIQTGGTVMNGPGSNLYIGSGATGVWHQAGGTLVLAKNSTWLDRSFVIGGSGRGVFNLGDAAGCGIVTQGVTGVGVRVRWNAPGSGLLRGWSDAGGGNRWFLTGPIYMNGQVVADGYGADRALDLSGMGTMYNELDNTREGANGWYARDRGELRLPLLTVSGNNTYYWGEQADLDLVNGARLAFTGASGKLTGKLFAVDHGAVQPAGAIRAISVHDFAVGGMTACTLKIRYDHAAAAALPGLVEANLNLYRWNGGAWEKLAAQVDTVTRTITAAGLTQLGRFMIGVPAPGTILFVQ
jgi:hypothetical protein